MNIVSVARVEAFHGIPKNGFKSLKARLFSKGGTLLKDVQQIWARKGPTGTWTTYEVAEASPLGGKWGQAAFVILRFSDSQLVEPGFEIGYPRELFPKLNSKSEVYLCDLLGWKIACKERSDLENFRVSGFEDHQSEVLGLGQANLASAPIVNIRAENASTGTEIEFPSNWILEIDSHAQTLHCVDLTPWIELKNEKPDDQD